MKAKKLICAALASTLTMSVAFAAGCDTINEEDMKQVIATVDISQSDALANDVKNGVALSEYAGAISSSREIVKRDLVAAFYNAGSSLVNSYSYAEIFEMLVDALTSTAVVTQYATLSLIRDKCGENAGFYQQYLDTEGEVERYELLLEGEVSDDAGSDRVMLAQYALYSSINSSLDSIEEGIIEGDGESTSSSDTRTTPTGAGAEVEDFLPLKDGKLNYGVYTGYSSESDGYDYVSDEALGIYAEDKLEGSTIQTRRKAYASFITNLRDNFLLTEEDGDVRDLMNISYIQEEYLAQLQQQVINEYYERYHAEQEASIDTVENGEYTFLKNRYESDLANQQVSNSTTSAFESSMSSLSDTSFILWNPGTEGTEGGTFGYVYNILLPFSAAQNVNINTSDTSAEYYFARKDILDDITTTDQRSAWFNGETDYSFDASSTNINYYGKDADRDYLFFEDNLTDTEHSRYEELDKYVGLYSYNGKVYENTDGSYALSPERLDINDMLEEFVNYVNYVLDPTGATTYASYDLNDGTVRDGINSYFTTAASDYYTAETADLDEDDREIDYSRFIYAIGNVELGETSLASMFVKDTDAYKAMSAVNELQYAYTTDTSVLSQYIGYTISAYDTDYVPEFEYAAQAAVEEGAGTFYVCAADYGWHIIYVTAVYSTSEGPVYGDVTWTETDVTTEGTFQNLYYNWIKDTLLADITDNQRSILNELYGGDTTVTLYEDAYADLMALDSQS